MMTMTKGWRDATPTGEDMAFWHEQERMRIARVNELFDLFPAKLWTRRARIAAPRPLATNGEWSDWLLEIEESCCDICRACLVSDANNPHTPEKRVREYPPSAALAMA